MKWLIVASVVVVYQVVSAYVQWHVARYVFNRWISHWEPMQGLIGLWRFAGNPNADILDVVRNRAL